MDNYYRLDSMSLYRKLAEGYAEKKDYALELGFKPRTYQVGYADGSSPVHDKQMLEATAAIDRMLQMTIGDMLDIGPRPPSAWYANLADYPPSLLYGTNSRTIDDRPSSELRDQKILVVGGRQSGKLTGVLQMLRDKYPEVHVVIPKTDVPEDTYDKLARLCDDPSFHIDVLMEDDLSALRQFPSERLSRMLCDSLSPVAEQVERPWEHKRSRADNIPHMQRGGYNKSRKGY